MLLVQRLAEWLGLIFKGGRVAKNSFILKVVKQGNSQKFQMMFAFAVWCVSKILSWVGVLKWGHEKITIIRVGSWNAFFSSDSILPWQWTTWNASASPFASALTARSAAEKPWGKRQPASVPFQRATLNSVGFRWTFRSSELWALGINKWTNEQMNFNGRIGFFEFLFCGMANP